MLFVNGNIKLSFYDSNFERIDMKDETIRIKAETILGQSPDKVWRVLTDFSAYPAWNPFIRMARGRLVEGGTLFLFLSMPGGMKTILFPKILEVKEGEGFRWIGSLLAPGLFHGEHEFTIIPEGENKSRLVQTERFGGVLTPLLGKFVSRGAKKGFDAMNASMRERLNKAFDLF